MTDALIAAANNDRFTRWGKRLADGHATAICLVGVGHDHKSGDLVMCAPEEGPSNQEIAAMLRWAANELDPAPF